MTLNGNSDGAAVCANNQIAFPVARLDTLINFIR
jgi:hypothetical protein